MLERVQQRPTKTGPELRDLNYRERTAALNLLTFADRRSRGDVIGTFKFVSGFDEDDT